ncbi:alpha/beta hydrolase family protein [Microbulbifer hydrolyticus]|uniref:Dienelactone hydrolase n=1 Tax=Microbulbifer hydrolyticus TaxID=48074 RepID=A0A6P1TC30_9GAMM|nr:dienelactone hydrolase [Microbulbifer hydrolyticus]MBB5210121.1 putative dienelactone hydrolase [Microbulbifer hydrolyticus]QHQ39361.1 dienelactone hydrolase [Microbulbifer hydrolyticus]
MYITRCIFDAFKVDSLHPPYDTGIARIYYPARYGGSFDERNTGAVPVDDALAPCPVLILFHGINIDPAGYRWLAETLASSGIVTVTYQLVAEEMPGYVAATPAIDIKALTPDQFGQRPSALAVPAILSMLEKLNTKGLLAGKLDLNRLAFGGHSAGGTLALLNANRDWFPALRAVFAYGAHTGASTVLGWPEETLLPVNADVPVLVIGGEQDGCIAHSAHRYGSDSNSATARIEQTFDKSIPENGGDNVLLLMHDANHFSFCTPPDDTCGRGFIDLPVETDRARNTIEQAIRLLIQGFLGGQSESRDSYRKLSAADHELISKLLRK